ncbi:AAA domain-containing protein, putative AbiEii toxin, Type IV TA system [Pseudomonas congelans]|uniref:AAA domain-containing protein, putative AbiEii toxin, Type IV TA system n=1 Tax=Pseudomonas congelans TaxID=200452 RepID=A0A0P9NPN4_9PSED|nr:ATP-binding protein [Pseudomonas congelans]KPW86648.1 Uncharacterized protein ALO92_00581 [Pseudomonas congelans]SDO48744.1 AAA domain-containing protein, putative AbiEii toxin, Type IV TA system [Pseudomonas congelans]
MPFVHKLSFSDWSGRLKEVVFSSPQDSLKEKGFHTTIITGQNGSHKSTILKELVSAIVLIDGEAKIQYGAHSNFSPHVICVSGSVADRFPLKEKPGGGSTEFDVPDYVYLGQRVGPNLLSKKRPLETLLISALDNRKGDRYKWGFFRKAHQFAGIKMSVKFELAIERAFSEDSFHLRDAIVERTIGRGSERGAPMRRLSPSTAKWLLNEFSDRDFEDFERFLDNGRKRVTVLLSDNGAICESIPIAMLRLGLLADVVGLKDVLVRSSINNSEFSIYELSSGEYHMYSSILGVGFGVEDSSIVLIDEPENSLHPQWQQDFMSAVFDIGSQGLALGHIIICTHSPLIVGAAPEGATIIDLKNEVAPSESSTFGGSSDEILLSQFGLASSRNRVVVDIIQRAVSLVERGDFGGEEFDLMKPVLASLREKMRPHDPIMQILDALLEEAE